MKHLRLFEGTRTDELKKFCTENLTYLIDNHFNFVVKVGRQAQVHSDTNFETKIIYPMRRLYDTIVVEKFIPSKAYSEVFEYNDFSDDLVPFILFLNVKYDIENILYLDENRKVRWPAISKEEYSNNNTDFDLSSLDDKKIKKLVITIKK